jgi:hypothetical protein
VDDAREDVVRILGEKGWTPVLRQQRTRMTTTAKTHVVTT